MSMPGTFAPYPIALVAAGLLLAGCASTPSQPKAQLTYKTVPGGAQLFEGSVALGQAPVTRTYLGDGKSGTITTPDVTAVWPSGAKTTFYTLLSVGDDRVATLQRPADAPGLQADLDNAQKVAATQAREAERLKALQHADQARASSRCQDQLSGRSLASADDCN